MKHVVYSFILLLTLNTFAIGSGSGKQVRPISTVLTENGFFCSGGRGGLMQTLFGTFSREDINKFQALKSEAEVDEWMKCYTTAGNTGGLKNYEATKELLKQAESEFGIPYALMACKVWQETRWVNGQISSENARGLVQIVPGQAKTLKDIMDLAAKPPPELNTYRKLVQQQEETFAEIRKLEKFMSSLDPEKRHRGELCALQTDCLEPKQIQTIYKERCERGKRFFEEAKTVNCKEGYRFAGENDALEQHQRKLDSLSGRIAIERKKEIVRNYDHGIVLRAAWQDWAIKHKLNPNFCGTSNCVGEPYNNIKWSVGAGALNSMYLAIKLDDDYNQKTGSDGEKMSYSRKEFQLIMAAAYNSGQHGPVQELKPGNEEGVERIRKFLENLRIRGAPGPKGWGQTVCYVNNIDSCMRPSNMRPASFENPSGEGERCGQKSGENLTTCR